MILTRYLYIKSKVEVSLKDAIQKHYYKDAVFWAYELYFSGFQKDVLDILENIYQTMFSKNHPKLGRYIKMKKAIETPELIATIIKNLTMKNPEIKETTGVKFVNVKRHHIEPFMTKECLIVWKTMREQCEYGVVGKATKEEIINFREHWIDFAVKSPIWLERVLEYNGQIDNGKVVFEYNNDEEEFYSRFGYELDEQPLIIQMNCIGKII
jgi:hypothetical protein